MATANVVMKVTISKSTSLRRPSSGCTDTSSVAVPKMNATTNASSNASTGLTPWTASAHQPT